MPRTEGPDEWLLRTMDAHRWSPATHVARGLEDVGTTPWVLALVAVVLVAVVVVRRAWWQAVAVVTSVVLAVGVAGLLKHVIGRARPPADLALSPVGGYSFPSTHAALTSSAALALALAARWRTERTRAAGRSLLLALTVLVGVSMVYLGAHWASDVLAGWVVGCAAALGVTRIVRHRGSRTNRPTSWSL